MTKRDERVHINGIVRIWEDNADKSWGERKKLFFEIRNDAPLDMKRGLEKFRKESENIYSISLLDDDWELVLDINFLPVKRSRTNFSTGAPIGKGEYLYK